MRQSIDIETEEVATEEQAQKARGEMRVSIYAKKRDQEYDEGAPVPMRVYHYSERLRLAAMLRTPRNFRNPGALDYRGYLAGRGITMLASAKNVNVEVLPGFVGTRLAW